MKKMTFTLDREAVLDLERASDRLRIPKSQVVREALQVYADQLGRLTDDEVRAKLAAFDKVAEELPDRGRLEVARELEAIRAARRGGGRRTSRG